MRVVNPLGLHARPAAQLVRLARGFEASVTIENLTRQAGPVSAGSINGVLGLGARLGDQLRIRADDPAALAQLSAFIETGCGEDVRPSGPLTVAPARPVRDELSPGQLAGIPASEGIAVGPLVRLRISAASVSRHLVDDEKAEWERLAAALRGAAEETRALAAWAGANAGVTEAGIFDAQALLLEDPALVDAVSSKVFTERVNAEHAWQVEMEALAARLRELDDPYLRARAADVVDVSERVMRRLAGVAADSLGLRAPCVLGAHDLAPSEVKSLDPAVALGLCLEAGSANAHSMILARAMGIPAVAGVGRHLSDVTDGTIVALDGEQGIVWVAPSPEDTAAIEKRRGRWLEARRAAEAARHRPAATRDGLRIRVVANIAGVPEAVEAVDCGAEGVGVLRTEFLFLNRRTAPTEEEQLAAYRTIAESLGGRPLVVRTLDVGGDKPLPYVEIEPESNPFLGWRGVRLTLGRPDLFLTQLRAILRAAAAHPVELLLPMVSSLEEVREVKALVKNAEAGLEREGLAHGRDIRIGVMIEVPAAAAIADQLAREASFFSIGTNDLIQYTMAADRTNPHVARIADPFQPAVLRVLRQVIEAARSAQTEVALCGELAADPLATPLLLGLGLEELSVSAQLIPRLKRSLSLWGSAEAERIARQALEMDTSEAVRRLLADARRDVD